MKKYAIYQINLTLEQINEVNSSDETPEFYHKVARTTCAPDASDLYDAIEMYEHVANIEAADLNGVFEIGNIGPEENIERLGPIMHSLSVGDIIVDTDEESTHYVDSFGFGQLLTNRFVGAK